METVHLHLFHRALSETLLRRILILSLYLTLSILVSLGETNNRVIAEEQSIDAYFFSVDPEPDSEISDYRTKAAILYQRLAGVKVPIDHPDLKLMENELAQGNDQAAAAIATATPSFYDVTVRDFAALMSTRDETLRAPMSDFIATIVGVARDDIDARLLLSGNFYYRSKEAGLANNSKAVITDVLTSNKHYEEIDKQGLSLYEVLEKVDGQLVMASIAATVSHPDPAGILTSRAWMEAHASAGTNRRLVEYTFREFLCAPMEQWADPSNPDDRVGRDVDRFPGGSNVKFQTSCKSCHSGMDSFRGAFAKIDFENDIVKHGSVLPVGTSVFQMKRSANGISNKMNANSDVFPDGMGTTSSYWINQSIRGLNSEYFGWRGSLQGSGIKSFGTMVANSKAFSKCMAKRAFSSVCKRFPTSAEAPKILKLAEDFESGGYKLRSLFEKVSIEEACLNLE